MSPASDLVSFVSQKPAARLDAAAISNPQKQNHNVSAWSTSA